MKSEDVMALLNPSLFRNVIEFPAYYTDNHGVSHRIQNKKVLAYEDTGEYIASVGDKYRVVQNEEVYRPFCEAIIESNLDLNGLDIRTSIGNAGRSLTSFIFPEHSVQLKNDITNLRIIARNSYDGTWKFQVDTGGFRVACANGQVVGNFKNAYNNKHTSSFSVKDMSKHLSHQIEGFASCGQWWMSLEQTPIDYDIAIDLVCKYLYNTEKTREDKLKLIESGKSTTFNKICELFDDYSKEMGENLYALYNAFTDHATHSSDVPEYQFDKSKRLLQVVETYLKSAA